MAQLFPLCWILFACGLSSINAQTLFNSPADYFGGSGHEDYLDWVAERGSNYNASLFLEATTNSTVGAAIHWSILEEEELLQIAVAVHDVGWLGFGLSENGGMQGADVLLFETAEPDTVTDSHILDVRWPVPDVCNDWVLKGSRTMEKDGSSFLIVEAERFLDTDDPQDRAIFPDSSQEIPTSRIIAAWGNTERASYHLNNRARGAIRWFGLGANEAEIFVETMAVESDGFFEVKANNHEIADRDTTYIDFCASQNDILAQGVPAVPGLTLVGFEPIVTETSSQYVHHFTVYGGPNTNNGVACSSFATMFELVYAWAPGGPPVALPLDVGKLLGPGSLQSFRVEIHYNNPQLDSGVLDSSGVRFYYSTDPRPIEMGVLQLGDPFLSLGGQVAGGGSGYSQHTFECPGECSGVALGDTEVTVFREYLHMHQTGLSASNELIRDGEIVHIGRIDFFNFDQQGNQAVVQEPFQVRAGDAFRSTFHYWGEPTVFGLSSQQEMAIAFLFYYPRQTVGFGFPWICYHDGRAPDQLCESSHSSTVLPTAAGLGRVFGPTAEECSATPPTDSPTTFPSSSPTMSPTAASTDDPTALPTSSPSNSPTSKPTSTPTSNPSELPVVVPTPAPTPAPIPDPTPVPSTIPTEYPLTPGGAPTTVPTPNPTTTIPTEYPSTSVSPTTSPTPEPTFVPSTLPTEYLSTAPTWTASPTATNAPTGPVGPETCGLFGIRRRLCILRWLQDLLDRLGGND